VDDRHVRAGAYVVTEDGYLFAVLDRRVNSLISGSEALVEDVGTPTREQRYLDPVQVAKRPLRWRACRLGSGVLVDADAETMSAWIPVGNLVGAELVRGPVGLGVSSFPR
jgi:hypothetical protein